jgi:hypothetical protein
MLNKAPFKDSLKIFKLPDEEEGGEAAEDSD